MKLSQPWHARSLTTTLAITFFTLSMVILLVYGILALFFITLANRDAIASKQQLIAQNAAKTVSAFIQDKFNSLRTVVRFADPMDANAETRKAMLETLLGQDPSFRQVALLDTAGHQLAGDSFVSNSLSSQFIAQLHGDILTQTSKGQNYIGPVYIENVSNEPLTVIAVPVKDVFGDVQGTLVAEVDLKFMWDLVGQLQVGATGYAYVVDSKGNLIAFGNASRVLRGENEQQILAVKEFLRNLSASTDATEGVANYTGLLGTTVVGTYVPLGTPQWAVITEMPWKEAYRTVLQIVVASLASIFAIAVLAGIAGILIARRLTRPLNNLMETATRISRGEIEFQTAVSGPREVMSLATAFNNMTVQLRELISSLEQRVAYRTAELGEANQQLNLELAAHERSEALFRALFELSPDSVLLIDPHDSNDLWPIVDCNAAACRMNGYSRDELIGHSIDVLNETPGNRSERIDFLNLVREAGNFKFQTYHRHKNGKIFSIESSTSLITVGERELIIGIDRDITERLRLEGILVEERNLLRTLIDSLPDSIFIKDLDGRIVMNNIAHRVWLGVTALEQVVGKTDFDFFPQEVAASYHADEEQVIQSGKPLINQEEPCVGKDQDQRWLLATKVPLRDHQGIITGLVGHCHDITERKQAEATLEQSLSTLHATLEATADGILVVDGQSRIVNFNQRFTEMWRIPGAIMESRNADQALEFVLDQLVDHQVFVTKVRMLVSRPEMESFDMLLFKDGRVFEYYSQPQQIAGQSVGRVWSFRDVTERKRAEEKLAYSALHDSLTNLPNRALFMDRIQQAMHRAKRHKNYRFAVLFLDLDHFKVVNDSLGHNIGDLLLIESARRLAACLRSEDTVARLGGDEFVILLEGVKDPKDVTHVADRIQADLAMPFNLEDHQVFISASIGIVLNVARYELSEDILRDADIAMYRAKRHGRRRYKIFDRAMLDHATTRLELETDLRNALDRQEFIIHYQPIVKLENRRIVGFEALARWQHPTRGLLLPSEFIPFAEETGLIVPIDDWVLTEACHQIREWQVQFPIDPPLTISVNLSAKQCAQTDLVQKITKVLRKTGLNPGDLKLELTESMIVKGVESTSTVLSKLRALGVQIHIDDFGTGYSSLGYLQTLPIDSLKIDRTFISRIGTNGGGSDIVRTILTLAHDLRMKVIAEGVETDEQLSELKSLECEFGQGYLFTRPIDKKKASTLLAKSFAGVEG